MKVILLHGAAIVSSRKKLIDLKNKFDQNSILVFGEGSDFEDIKNNLVATPLFSSDRLVVLENPPEDFTFDSSGSFDSLTLVFWFDHEISDKKPILAWVKKLKGEIFYFPESKEISVFPLLDYLATGDKKAFLEINKLKNAGFDIFYFITMVFYLLRNMVATKENAPQFVQSKFQKQRARFTKEDLERLYKDILEFDFKIKSGFIETKQAEFFLVSKFIS